MQIAHAGERSGTMSFTSAGEWLKYMYGDVKGWITRATIQPDYNQWHYEGADIVELPYDGIENVYVSMNTFFSTYRQAKYLKRLNSLYIDIDCYKQGISKERALSELRTHCFGRTMPEPTFVIDSGRGLYLIWKISEDAKALPRWKRIMKYFYKQTKSLGADASAVEQCRILRVPFSVNSASGTPVTILSAYDHTYTLYEIIKRYNIEEYAKKVKKYQKKETKRNSEIQPNEDKDVPANIKKLLYGRIEDLKILFEGRTGPDCFRENALFLIRHWYYLLTQNSEYALSRMLQFNAALGTPHDTVYAIRATASAEKKVDEGGAYRYSNAKLVEFLNITPEESGKLRYIGLSNEELKKKRKREKNKEAYRAKQAELGKQAKSEILNERRAAIRKMLNQGMGRKEICAALSISEATYKRDKLAVMAMAASEVVKSTVDTVKKAAEDVFEKIKNLKNTRKENAKRGGAQKISPFIIRTAKLFRVFPIFLTVRTWKKC